MKNVEISKQIDRLNSLFDKANSLNSIDIEILSHWAKYLCVLCAGFIENSVKEVYSNYVKDVANEYVTNYVNQTLSRLRNPNMGKIIELTGSFNKSWKESLEKYVDDDGRKEAIDSLMANRHQIAHGKDSNISISRVKEYFKKAVKVVEYIENLI